MSQEEDKALKRLFRHNEVLAGILNHELYSDEERFRPECFTDGNPDELAVFRDLLKGRETTKEMHRDVCRILAWQSDGRRNYLFLGIENQSSIDPFMALRVAAMNIMNYDAQRGLYMDRQRRLPWDAGRRREALGLMREGKVLLPVLTIVVYTGKEPWDAPRSLREMLPVFPPLEASDIPDFQMRLLSLREIPEKNLPRCEKNLRTMVKYLKCEDDPVALANLLESDPDYQEVPVDTARAIGAITRTKIEIPQKQETVNMCYAQKVLLRQQWYAGRKDGMEKGIQSVIALARNCNLPREQVVSHLVQTFGLTQEEALAYLNPAH